MIKSFYTASLLYDVLTVFGELTEEASMQIIYLGLHSVPRLKVKSCIFFNIMKCCMLCKKNCTLILKFKKYIYSMNNLCIDACNTTEQTHSGHSKVFQSQ